MLGKLLSELRRRNVLTIMAAYAVGSFAIVSATDVIVPTLALPAWITTMMLVAAIALAPVVAFLSWFYELSPKGFIRVTDPTHAKSRPLTTWNWISLALVVASSIGLGYFIFEEAAARRAAAAQGGLAAPADKTLAVMVFRDLSPDKSLAYLAEGLAEDLSAALGKTPGLLVTAVSSTRQFADSTEAPSAIGTELGVSTMLEGSVRLEGSRMMITANLIDAASGKTRWSERFGRPFEDIFKVQQEISQAILNRIMDDYVAPEGGKATGQATSTDAYVMYLQGRQEFRNRTPDSIKKARKYFEQAAGLDPEYAPAYVGIADSVRLLARGLESYGDLDPAIAGEVAKSNVDKALLRDPKLPEAYAALGNVAVMRGDNVAALAAYDKAVQLNPSYADAHLWRFQVLRNLSRSADALASLETAKSLDPLSPVILKNWAVEKVRHNDVAAALATYDRLIKLYPDAPVGYRGAAEAAYTSGNLVRAAEYHHEALKRSPKTEQYRIALGEIYLMAGIPAVASKLLAGEEYKVNIALAAGDYPKALEIIRFSHAASPDDPLLSWEHGWYEMLYGDRERGREIMRTVDKTIAETGWFDRNYCSPNIEMSYAFPAGPDRDRWLSTCSEYVSEQQANGYSYSELWYLAARVAALQGKVAAAQKAFVEAIDAGWRQPWTGKDPLLADVILDPTSQTALRKLTDDLAVQKVKLEEKARVWGYLSSAPAPTSPGG